MDNPEKLATKYTPDKLATKDTPDKLATKYTPDKLATKDTPDKQNKKHNTICVRHHYAQTNTNNVNKTISI